MPGRRETQARNLQSFTGQVGSLKQLLLDWETWGTEYSLLSLGFLETLDQPPTPWKAVNIFHFWFPLHVNQVFKREREKGLVWLYCVKAKKREKDLERRPNNEKWGMPGDSVFQGQQWESKGKQIEKEGSKSEGAWFCKLIQSSIFIISRCASFQISSYLRENLVFHQIMGIKTEYKGVLGSLFFRRSIYQSSIHPFILYLSIDCQSIHRLSTHPNTTSIQDLQYYNIQIAMLSIKY